MVDVVEKAKAVKEVFDIVNSRLPWNYQFYKHLAEDVKGVDNLGKPLELNDEQVQVLSIASGITLGVIAFWAMNNPDVIKTIAEQMGKVGANLIPDISVTGGTA